MIDFAYDNLDFSTLEYGNSNIENANPLLDPIITELLKLYPNLANIPTTEQITNIANKEASTQFANLLTYVNTKDSQLKTITDNLITQDKAIQDNINNLEQKLTNVEKNDIAELTKKDVELKLQLDNQNLNLVAKINKQNDDLKTYIDTNIANLKSDTQVKIDDLTLHVDKQDNDKEFNNKVEMNQRFKIINENFIRNLSEHRRCHKATDPKCWPSQEYPKLELFDLWPYRFKEEDFNY